ncbi:MAG: toprim domain-containing protein [Alphaproteobacteria bacterium]|nr:toprim domain-containing protein [Alphaproteobacteria bacterium]
MDVSEIARLLADKIDVLVREILPNAKLCGHEWQVGSVAGEVGGSMCINNGTRRGVWKDFSGGKGGDALDLVAEVLFAGDKKRAVDWAKSWLGLDNLSPDRLKQVRQEAKKSRDDAQKSARDSAVKRLKIAKAMWLASYPEIGGSPVDHYLMNRAIDLGRLPKLPQALRYAPELEHMNHETGEITKWPAMIASITGEVDGKLSIVGVHRTYLAQDNYKVWRKAPVEKPKLTLGNWRGGYIPISRGISGKTMKDAPEGDVVVIAEGIEDALSIALLYPERRVIASVSIGNMQNIELPNAIEKVYIAVDNDHGNKQAEAAISNAIKKFYAEGRDVFTMRSPAGKDFNDFIQKYKTTAGDQVEQVRR